MEAGDGIRYSLWGKESGSGLNIMSSGFPSLMVLFEGTKDGTTFFDVCVVYWAQC